MSIATEITRLQTAKSDLKTSINAKTDASHQITTETIDDYADFVDTIQTGSSETTADIMKTFDLTYRYGDYRTYSNNDYTQSEVNKCETLLTFYEGDE